MKQVNGRFTQYMNRRHKWVGHVFAGRFKAIVIDDTGYLRTALAYIAKNPVEAGLVADPERWEWSSYAAAMGLRPPPRLLAMSWIRRALPADTLAESRRMFSDRVAGLSNTDFDQRAVVLGDASTRAQVRELIATTMYLDEIPRAFKALARPPLDQLLACVTRAERATAIRRAHVLYGYKLSEIARCLGVHSTTISRILVRPRSNNR